MTAPVIQVRIDWDDDGVFESGIEDVTGYVLGTIQITRGRDQIRALSPPMAPTLALTLDNSDGRFWPDLATSPLYPNVEDPHAIRVQAVHASITYTLFTGQTTVFQPDLDTRRVPVQAIGGVQILQGESVSTELYNGIRTGAAVEVILDEIGWPSAARAIDAGASWLPWWWETGGGAYESLLRLVACEGPPARIDIAANGTFVFEDRHHRLLNSASSVATLSDTGSEPLLTRPFTVEPSWDAVINDVSIPVERMVPGVRATVCEWDGEAYVASFGADVQVYMECSSPVTTAGTLFVTIHDKTGVGTAQATAFAVKAQTVGVNLSPNGDGDLTVTKMEVTGHPLVVAEDQLATAVDSASVAAYGSRGIPGGLDAPFLSLGDAQALADTYVAYYKSPLQRAVAILDGDVDTRLAHQLGRDVSDRVTVVASEAGVNRAYYVEQVTQEIEPPLPWVTTRFGVEECPTPVVAANQVAIVGNSTQGRVGVGKVGL